MFFIPLQYSTEPFPSQKTTFPAREIYERTLPEVVERLSDVFYHPGSPWGGKDTRDPTVGDIHQWVCWLRFWSFFFLLTSLVVVQNVWQYVRSRFGIVARALPDSSHPAQWFAGAVPEL